MILITQDGIRIRGEDIKRYRLISGDGVNQITAILNTNETVWIGEYESYEKAKKIIKEIDIGLCVDAKKLNSAYREVILDLEEDGE